MKKLQVLMQEEGIGSEEELIQKSMTGDAPAICMNEGCCATYSYEPDCTRGWCDECETNSVKSGMSMLGF